MTNILRYRQFAPPFYRFAFLNYAYLPNWFVPKYRKFSEPYKCHLKFIISRKVLRPTTSTQVFLGFPVPISKC